MNRKYIFVKVLVAVLVTITAGGFINKHAPVKKNVGTTAKGFAVVELFTSEGCSSCPAADKAVATLLAKNTANVYILAYHVDYWDRLGWKDPFSSRAWSDRQNHYATAFNLDGVYTPQVVVNGAAEFVGSDEAVLNTTVERDLQTDAVHPLTINIMRNSKQLTVNYNTGGKDAVLLNLAIVQPESTISVKKGENGGKTLHHVNIVRTLTTIEAGDSGTTSIAIPEDLLATPFQLISFTQEKDHLHILAGDKKIL